MTLEPILVTGATGFIGRALARSLAARGLETTCLVRSAERGTRLLPHPECRVVEVPSFEPAAVLHEAVAGRAPRTVFHLAASGVAQGDRDPGQLVAGNVSLLADLLAAAADWPVARFIHVGSCAEYGERTEPLDEDAPLAPTSLYGAAKAAATLLGRPLAKQLGVPLLVLRPFGVFGPGEAPRRLLPHLLAKLTAGEDVPLTPGDQERDFLYVGDVVRALFTAASTDGLDEGIFNVCSGIARPVRDVALAVAEAVGRPASALRFGAQPARPDEAPRIVGDGRRFEAATSWRPRFDLDEGLARSVAAWREGRWEEEPTGLLDDEP